MKNTIELKEFSQLAQAAYSILDRPDIHKNETAIRAALQASPNGAFAEGQAVDFAGRYWVLHQFRDVGTTAKEKKLGSDSNFRFTVSV
jgi:hypothetical protein